jgi:hypothetical protein
VLNEKQFVFAFVLIAKPEGDRPTVHRVRGIGYRAKSQNGHVCA